MASDRDWQACAAGQAPRLLRRRRPRGADRRGGAQALRRRRSTCARRSCTTSTWSPRCEAAGRDLRRGERGGPRGLDRGLLRARRGARGATSRPRRASCKAIDATCPLVTKVHQEAKRFAADDYDILLIGHEGHEEVVGTAGEAPGAHPARRRPRRRRQGDRARPEQGRLALPDHAVGRRDDGDGGPAQAAAAAAAVAAQRRHLLRHVRTASTWSRRSRRSATW